MGNYANTPGPKPGNTSAVNMHKSIASGMTMPASKRTVKTQLKGSTTGCAKVPGLSNR
jgi:hypothetical protein